MVRRTLTQKQSGIFDVQHLIHTTNPLLHIIQTVNLDISQHRQAHASVKRAQPGTTRTGPTRQSARLAPQARGAARVTGSALCAALASPTVLLLRLTRVLVQTAQPAARARRVRPAV